jgi:hypothetical protein
MSRIPAPINALMWRIAEEGSPQAASEFEERYPEHATELSRRIEMLHDLKGARPASLPQVAALVPRFAPRETRLPPSPRMIAWTSGLVLAAVASAAYAVSMLTMPVPTPAVKPNYAAPTVKAPVAVDPDVNPTNPVTENEAPAPPVATPLYMRPQDLRVQHATLSAVIDMIGKQGKISILAAPGMPNPTVDADYDQVTTMEMLNDLGVRYGFTPFDQGDGSIVIYPVRDPNAHVYPANGLDSRESLTP